MTTPDFAPGQTVRIIARPEVTGVVIGSHDVGGQLRFDVFHGSAPHGYFASQLETTVLSLENELVPAAKLQAGLTSELLRDPNTSYLHAKSAGRIDYEPYQFRPVLKLVQADRPRLLIADDVGVGKTIEACLILKELQARQRADTVLVICPKPLVVDDKWRSELKRFDEDFVHLDGADLRFCLEETLREGAWPSRFSKAIVPYSLLDEKLLVGEDAGGRSRRIGLTDLAPGPHFDLIIVDEAHHIRNRSTFAYQNVRHLTSSADAVVLLSATPLQTDSQDLYTLVNLLRDDLVPDPRDFAQMLEPNHHLYEAVEAARRGAQGWQADSRTGLENALATDWGRQVMRLDARVEELNAKLSAPASDDRNRIRVVRLLEDLNTYSPIISRTRRRDIGEFTTRKPSAPLVEFTPAQSEVYEAVLDLGRRIMSRRAPGMPVEFLVSMLRRQAASSISGLAPLVHDLLNERLDGIEYSPEDDTTDVLDLRDNQLRSDVAHIGTLAETLIGAPDPKLDVLHSVIADKQTQDNNKVLVFSTFRHTLGYLTQNAQRWGVRVGLVHGGIADDDRHALRRRFKLGRTDPDAIDVMFCSEVGTEGLDYQFCDMLVNYDIPWNPMAIEQRIGRIDRRGQASQSVSIVNILTQGTIESEIYERCMLRIGVFHRALGGSEKILGDLTTELRRLAENMTLSEDDQRDRLKQLADNEVARIYELERLEEQQGALLGLTTEAFDSRVAEASSTWLEENRIADLVREYLADLTHGRRLALKPGKITIVRLDDDMASRLTSELTATGSRAANLIRQLNRKPAVINIATSAADIEDASDVELLTATHPLVEAASTYAALTGVPSAVMRIVRQDIAPGRYPIAIHAWTRLDARDSSTLRYISTSTEVEEQADELLSLATQGDADDALTVADSAALARRHSDEWVLARQQHVDHANNAARQRIASLQAQKERQLKSVADSLVNVNDSRIRKMRESESTSIRDRFDRMIASQQRGLHGADLVTREIAQIVMEVVAP